MQGIDVAMHVRFADKSTWQNQPGDAEVTIVFRTARAQWRTLVLGYVGFFEAWFEGDVDILGERATGKIMWIAYRSQFRYASNPILTVMRRYLEYRNSNRTFAAARANARRHYGLPHRF